MFDGLSGRLQQTVKRLKGQGRLTDENMSQTLRDVRMALLEADVALPVAKDFIEQGGLGKILGTQIVMLRDRSEDYLQRNTWQEVNPNWHGVKAKSGGGLFIDNGSHYLDYFRYLTGQDVRSVFAQADTFLIPADVEDSLSAIIGYDNGFSGSIIAGSAVRGCGKENNRNITNSLQRVWGEYGQIILEPKLSLFSLKRIGKYEPNHWHYPGKKWGASKGAGVKERIEFVDMFAGALLEDRPLEITGEDGFEVMKIIDAVYRSAALRKKVDIRHTVFEK